MAAYAEGLAILPLRQRRPKQRTHAADAETTPLRDPEHYQYDMNLRDIAEVWRRGMRDRILVAGPDRQRTAAGPKSVEVCRSCSDSGEGRWTIKAAIDEAVPAPVSHQRPLRAIQLAGEADSPTSSCPRCDINSAGISKNPTQVQSGLRR